MLDRIVARAAATVTHTKPPRVFTEVGKHPRLFRAWLPFAGALLLHGELPRADAELVVLRTAWNSNCLYQWAQHLGLAERNGLDRNHIAAMTRGADGDAWTPRQVLLLRAVDELHRDRMIGGTTRRDLEEILSERELIELCFLVGHYEMLAMLLNTREIEPDAPAG